MLKWWLLCLAGTSSSTAYRFRSSSDQRGDWQDAKSLNVRLWTWNSGKASLEDEAARLASTEADFIVTCQTEAKKSISSWMPAEWMQVAHGQHWGAAGGTINAQMASVFARRPVYGRLFGNVSELIGQKPWASDVADETDFRREDLFGSEEVVFKARTQVMATDYKGKGGVSVALRFPKSAARPATRLDFVCAHLDSESVKVRHAGIAYMMSKVRTYNSDFANQLRSSAISSKGGELLYPCSFFDRQTPGCPLEDLGLSEPPDAVVLLGDLNYRLAKGSLTTSMPPLEVRLLSPGGRRKIASHDPLASESEFVDDLVKPIAQTGYGFECNRPYAEYLPTYKRTGGEECQHLGEKLSGCSGPESGNYCKFAELQNLTRQCYMKLDKAGDLTWPEKKGDLQLGWLDRFCFRKTSNKLDLTLSVHEDEGWMDVPGAKDKKAGSDHMPVAATLQIGYSRCGCPNVDEEVIVDACKEDQPLLIGQQTLMHCGQDQVLVDKFGQTLSPLTLQCGADGLLTAQPASPVGLDTLQCRKACSSYVPLEPAEHGQLLDLSLPVVEGARVTPTCLNDSVLLGATSLQCEAPGLTPVDGLPPICVPRCRLPSLPGDLWVNQRLPVADQRLKGPYGPQILEQFTHDRQAILDGGEVLYACRRSCAVLGPSVSHCVGGEMAPPATGMRCACTMDLVVEAASFESKELKSQVDYLKLQFYAGPLTSPELESKRESKGYESALKFKPEEALGLRRRPLAVSLDRLADMEAHVTLCSKTAPGFHRHRFFSSCGILSQTSAGQGQKLKELLHQLTAAEGTLALFFGVAWRNSTSSLTLRVKYTTDLAQK